MKTLRKYLFISIAICGFLFSCSSNDENPEPEKDKPVFSISPKSIKLPLHDYLGWELEAILDGVKLPDDSVIWVSENSEIAIVREDGVIFGKSKGETNIIATLISDGRTAKCKVTIIDNNKYKLRLTLKDKGTSQFSISNPGQFLSAKAIQRRVKYNIPVIEDDLPISEDYIRKIETIGGKIVVRSKWLKTVTVYCEKGDLSNEYLKLPFVEKIDTVWIESSNDFEPEIEKSEKSLSIYNSNIPDIYGKGKDNISVNNGYVLHKAGYKGQGIDIAVIDGGFINFDKNSLLSNVHVKGSKSFIYEDNNPHAVGNHGIWVLSTMATNVPDIYIGTAPEANYWLLRTEDQAKEYPAEEDYWVAALEYADSVGVDIVTTSLAYTSFDYGYKSYTAKDMDGKTAYSTRAANVGAQKGIFIVCCSGNHRDWVGTPGDSPNVLNVGSVDIYGLIDDYTFTAWGMTQDGRIKPDVVSLGSGAYVVDPREYIDTRSGSSYATPIISGLAACLWQAYPQLTNKEIIDVIRKSSDRYATPVLPYGYGIPNMEKAMEIAKNYK